MVVSHLVAHRFPSELIEYYYLLHERAAYLPPLYNRLYFQFRIISYAYFYLHVVFQLERIHFRLLFPGCRHLRISDVRSHLLCGLSPIEVHVSSSPNPAGAQGQELATRLSSLSFV